MKGLKIIWPLGINMLFDMKIFKTKLMKTNCQKRIESKRSFLKKYNWKMFKNKFSFQNKKLKSRPWLSDFIAATQNSFPRQRKSFKWHTLTHLSNSNEIRRGEIEREFLFFFIVFPMTCTVHPCFYFLTRTSGRRVHRVRWVSAHCSASFSVYPSVRHDPDAHDTLSVFYIHGFASHLFPEFRIPALELQLDPEHLSRWKCSPRLQLSSVVSVLSGAAKFKKVNPIRFKF